MTPNLMNKSCDNIVDATQEVLVNTQYEFRKFGLYIHESGFNPYWDERLWMLLSRAMRQTYYAAFSM
jgi:hypothetical protein